MLGASETPYDLRFQLLGIPVRVHPVLLAGHGDAGLEPENIPLVLIWIGLRVRLDPGPRVRARPMAKTFRGSPSIVL